MLQAQARQLAIPHCYPSANTMRLAAASHAPAVRTGGHCRTDVKTRITASRPGLGLGWRRRPALKTLGKGRHAIIAARRMYPARKLPAKARVVKFRRSAAGSLEVRAKARSRPSASAADLINFDDSVGYIFHDERTAMVARFVNCVEEACQIFSAGPASQKAMRATTSGSAL